MATLLKVLNNLADIKSVGGVALQVRTQGGCSHSFNSLGALYRRPEILTGPKLGTLKMPARYRIYYESAKPGTDYIKMRLHFINGSERVSAIYEYKITVVDHPI